MITPQELIQHAYGALATITTRFDGRSIAITSAQMIGGKMDLAADGHQFTNARLLCRTSMGGGRVPSLSGLLEIDSFTADQIVLKPRPGLPVPPDGTAIACAASGSLNIAVAADIDRATELYTQRTVSMAVKPPFLFIIMGDVDSSRDQHSVGDTLAMPTAQDMNQMTVIQRFSLACFIPAKDDIGAAGAQQLAYGAIAKELISAFSGVVFSGSAQAIRSMFESHGPGPMNDARYVHVYDFQAPTVTTWQNGINGTEYPDDVPFLRIYQDMGLGIDSDVMKLTTELDQ
ncbi:hypothetical protein [Pseudomonas arsenicoxydans]|uniref:Uncharacterized protein n=1 Tax=Pseudomonas arsenicoxydans TaxID=702115 RepID=A0A502HRN3_9PSED|nr:hypothetical protein [Pseudomonas arsenicoxydans]TPG76314.1 hypothetical protein EAH78_18295 [Pseudomonas arsenicoxydans]